VRLLFCIVQSSAVSYMGLDSIEEIFYFFFFFFIPVQGCSLCGTAKKLIHRRKLERCQCAAFVCIVQSSAVSYMGLIFIPVHGVWTCTGTAKKLIHRRKLERCQCAAFVCIVQSSAVSYMGLDSIKENFFYFFFFLYLYRGCLGLARRRN
jgi:CRISPR/Cas system-associated endoribonuclease Cas2